MGKLEFKRWVFRYFLTEVTDTLFLIWKRKSSKEQVCNDKMNFKNVYVICELCDQRWENKGPKIRAAAPGISRKGVGVN